MKRVFQ